MGHGAAVLGWRAAGSIVRYSPYSLTPSTSEYFQADFGVRVSHVLVGSRQRASTAEYLLTRSRWWSTEQYSPYSNGVRVIRHRVTLPRTESHFFGRHHENVHS